MRDNRGHGRSLHEGGSELFCLEVYLAGIKTCLFSQQSSSLPSVLLCLLDFEPLVFDTMQEEEGVPSQNANNSKDGHDGPPISFPCKEGKSCFFEANPARLSRDIRSLGALTLMVVSKLSKQQAAIHGSCPVDLSTFGPNPELSRSLPRAVSSWGHYSHRVESKDLRGRTVATAELTVSLSCLGAAGALCQFEAPTSTASSQPPGQLGDAAAAPPLCIPLAARCHAPPVHSSASGKSLGEKADETDRQSAVGGKSGSRVVAGDRSDERPPLCEGHGGWFGKQKQGGTSWTCEFDPRDGSFTEVATSTVNGAPGTVIHAGLENSDQAGRASVNGGDEVRIAAGSAKGASSNREKPHGTASQGDEHATPAGENLSSPSSPGSLSSPTPPAAAEAMATVATAPAVVETVDLEPATSTPPTPMSIVRTSETGRVPPLPASEGKGVYVDGADKALVQIRAEAVGMVAEDAPRVVVLPGRRAAGRALPGNNHLINAWRPSGTPPEPDGGIEFNGWWSTTGVSGAAAPAGGGPSKAHGSTTPKRSLVQRTVQAKKRTRPATARAKTSVSARRHGPDRRRLGVSGGTPRQTSRVASTSTTTTTTACENGIPTAQRERRGKAGRRPWGWGPGQSAGSTTRGSSRPRPKTSRERRTGGEEHDRRRRTCPSGSPCPRGSSHARTFPPRCDQRKETSSPPPGRTLLEQFLPTWTSLVAEAAWLRGTEAAPRAGDVTDGGGGRAEGGRETDFGVTGAPARPAKVAERSNDGVSGSATFRSGSAEHRRPTSTSGGSAFEMGNFRQGSVLGGKERRFGREGGGPRHGCGVPAPSLDPGVERVLMDWLKSRVNRNGRLIPPGRGDSSRKFPGQGDLEELTRENGCCGDGRRHGASGGCSPPIPVHARRGHDDDVERDNHHRQEQQPGVPCHPRDGRGVDDAQRPVDWGTSAATTGRLYKMFEQALEGLLLQKENMVPATGTSRAVDGGDRDGALPPCGGIGWVEVVRRVSEITEEERAQGLTATTITGQQPSHERDGGRGSHGTTRTAHTDQTYGVSPGDGNDGGRERRAQRSTSALPPSADSDGSGYGPALRPPPTCSAPHGQHRPTSPPPRLPALVQTPRSPPLNSPLPPLVLPRGSKTSPRRTPPAAAAPSPPSSPASGVTDPRSPQVEGSPRARRWLLGSSHGLQPRGYVDDGRPLDNQASRMPGDAAGLGESEEGGGLASGGLIGTTETSEKTVVPGLVGHGARKEAGDVCERASGAPGAEDGPVSPLRSAAACRSTHKATVYGGDRPTEEEEEEEDEEEDTLILEEYESDFEEEEDEE